MKAPVFNGIFKNVIQKVMGDPQPATYRSADSSVSCELKVIFLDNHREVDPVTGIAVGAPNPQAWIEQGIVMPEYGDYIEIEGHEYLIREVEPAAEQYIKLILQDDRR